MAKKFKVKNPKSSPLWFCNRKPPTKECKHGTDVVCPTCNPLFWNPGEKLAREYTIQCLTLKIKQAKKAYYAGRPILRDEEYDALEGSLRAFDPDAKILQKVGAPVEVKKKKKKLKKKVKLKKRKS